MPFSEEAAQRAVNFFERVLVHIDGRWANQPFLLMPWQRDRIIRPLFGTLNDDGTRQYRTCFCEVPRKNGKSETAAGIALYLLAADREAGAMVFGAAGDRDQAGLVFRVAAQMVRRSSTLSRRLRVVDSSKRIIDEQNASFYRAIPSDAAGTHGLNAHGIVVDEVHVLPSRDLIDVLVTSTGARRQPLTFMITTAGFDRLSIAYEYHTYALRVQSGEIDDPTFLPVIYAADDTDDWRSPATWRKANPSLGVTISESFLAVEARKAQEVTAYESTFRRLYLNIWTSVETRWLDMQRWDASSRGTIDESLLTGRRCYGGLDLATTTDLAAWVLVFPREPEDDQRESLTDLETILADDPVETDPDGETSDDEESETYRAPDQTIYDVLCRFWIPENNIEARMRRDRVPYDAWVRQGLITATPGDVIDYGTIRAKIIDDSRAYDLVDLGFDRWGATQITQELADADVEVVPVGQGYQSMSPPTKELLRLVIGRRIEHGGNPVLRWMVDNVRVTTDAAENVKPDKARSRSRIDGCVAMIMALDRAIRNAERRSTYESHGLLVL